MVSVCQTRVIPRVTPWCQQVNIGHNTDACRPTGSGRQDYCSAISQTETCAFIVSWVQINKLATKGTTANCGRQCRQKTWPGLYLDCHRLLRQQSPVATECPASLYKAGCTPISISHMTAVSNTAALTARAADSSKLGCYGDVPVGGQTPHRTPCCLAHNATNTMLSSLCNNELYSMLQTAAPPLVQVSWHR